METYQDRRRKEKVRKIKSKIKNKEAEAKQDNCKQNKLYPKKNEYEKIKE